MRIEIFSVLWLCFNFAYMALKILSWNVNGIRAAVRNGFEDFLKTAKADILCLQEIKLDDTKREQTSFDFGDYEEYWFPAIRKGYSGTAILVRNGLKIKGVRNGFGAPEFDNEGRAQILESDKFFLINAYFPNAQPALARLAYKEAFNAAILRYIKKLAVQKPVLIGGDFNVAHQEIDLARPRANVGSPGFSAEERAWADRFTQADLIDTFRHFHPKKIQYSWWSYRANARANNVGWRIDYFWASAKLIKYVEKAFILDEVRGSDHCPVGIELEF